MSDFLLELRCEEIPARMQAKARADLEKLFAAQLKDAGLEASNITTYSTPRRLALIARGLPDQTEAVSEERKGPRADAPEQALAGFLRSTGLSREDLVEREVKGKSTLFAIIEKAGQPTAEILAAAIPSIVAAFPWPKSQRWGAASISSESLKWVRPLSTIIALFDGNVVDCEVHGIKSGRTTMGHRFHSEGAIEIASADEYADKLRSAHVIVDHEERQNIVRDGAAKAASDAGLTLVEDEGLVIENAGLTEWPVPLLGRFDASFLDVPEEVIQLTTRINQKYFVVRDKAGKLTNAFICTANIDAIDGGDAIVAGNEKVLAARLGDAKFFWELDQKTSLAVHGEKLSNIVFHEKLGTLADKVERVAKLARWLCEQGIVTDSRHAELDSASSETSKNKTLNRVQGDELSAGELADLAEQAAKLCKADLVTEMVGEFPELQGLMGGYYAAKEGLDPAVSNAIRDHYKPVGQSDNVPTDPVTVAVSLADKLDTLAGFFCIGQTPTGSKDPFALRRAAIGIIRVLELNNIRLKIHDLFDVQFNEILDDYPLSDDTIARRQVIDELEDIGKLEHQDTSHEVMEIRHEIEAPIDTMYTYELLDFLADRLKVQQKEAGVRHDLIDAVFALGGEDDLVRLLARVHALQAFVETEDGVNLLAGYKRASNILKKEGDQNTARHSELDSESIESAAQSNKEWMLKQVQHDDNMGHGNIEDVEKTLFTTLEAAETKAAAAIQSEDFEGAMSALASLRAPIDAFFDGVMVNDPDSDKKRFRLGLLTRFRDAVHNVADFAKIEG